MNLWEVGFLCSPPLRARRIISISIAAILFAASSSIAQQLPAAPPPELPNPSAGANLPRPGVGDVLGLRTSYEFWLTCIIIIFGLLVMLLVVWHFRSIPERRAEDVARPIIIIMVITGTLILVTAGYSNEQIAPAFGLFGTIIGYILGRLTQQRANGDASTKPEKSTAPPGELP